MHMSGNPLFRTNSIGIISFRSGINSDMSVKSTPKLWFNDSFESGFSLQSEVISDMAPERVDFYSVTSREYLAKAVGPL